MPYSTKHKEATRKQIVESARVLFNRYGFENVTIDMIMQHAGLTRGGFYNHFKNKQVLYSEAVTSFLTERGARWRDEAGINSAEPSAKDARLMLLSYLSDEHLGDADGQCPMIALPSDVARAGPEVQKAFENLLSAMTWLFDQSLSNTNKETENRRQTSLSLAALCVGGMVLARAIPESTLAKEIRDAALQTSEELLL
ncbi:MAG: TetR/AcrR family transcriptional regulator [Paraglaciecola sp.]|uniref:TetR/AcrR family transcriptional regulator n=1 Tax=Paraglaciecola sp. TaxID=1920173 RepID=UPI003265A759